MSDLTELIDRYIAAWNETDAARRRRLIAQAWNENGNYLDPLMHGYGHDGVDAMLQQVQSRFPGHRFSRVGDVDSYRDRVRFTWEVAPQDAHMPDAMRMRGTDFGVIAAGRLQSITGFFDPLPEERAAPSRGPAKPRGWSVERFAAFWAKPDAAMVPHALTPDVVGYWPGGAQPVRGIVDYTRRIADLLALVPDFRLEVAEHAASGDCVFIRWIAHGTGDDGPLRFSGVDRVRVRDGLVAENMIFCDHPLIHALARRSAPPAPAVPGEVLTDRIFPTQPTA